MFQINFNAFFIKMEILMIDNEIEQHEKLKQLNMAVYKPLEKPFVNIN